MQVAVASLAFSITETDMYVDQHWLREVTRSDVAKIFPLLYLPDHNDNIHIELFHIKK